MLITDIPLILRGDADFIDFIVSFQIYHLTSFVPKSCLWEFLKVLNTSLVSILKANVNFTTENPAKSETTGVLSCETILYAWSAFLKSGSLKSAAATSVLGRDAMYAD